MFFSLAKHKRDVFFAGEWLDGAFLDNLNDLWFAVGINLLVGNSLDELTVIFEDAVHLVFQLYSEINTFSFFYFRSLRLAFVTEIFSYSLYFVSSYSESLMRTHLISFWQESSSFSILRVS